MIWLRRLPLLIGVSAAIAGCGSSSPSSHPASSPVAGHPTALWTARLSGATGHPHGAPAGRGVAIVALHGPTVLCWRLAHLHGFTSPTAAELQTGPRASVFVALRSGTVFHHQGCRHILSGQAAALQAHPSAYRVSIASAAYPSGAVRGRL
ncbi:MAG TPA: CHRD domain-containing protein [Solirubrobacteraceae bacterium]|nr:CHRD domain-containing protein [Solirubrobacteraceae bacterium]